MKMCFLPKILPGRPLLMAGALCLAAAAFVSFVPAAGNFSTSQLKFSRVAEARESKDAELKKLFVDKKLSYPAISGIYFRIFKEEGIFEAWALDGKTKKYVLLKEYEVCRASGGPGPKRKEGDLQVPEGFYEIDAFNPWSSYHLSMRINYPNASDLILSDKTQPGGNICIHGNCVTIGCVPMTDDKIKEIYWMAVLARDNGQRHIPVHIFPARPGGDAMKKLQTTYGNDKAMLSFWSDLKAGYDHFQDKRKVPVMSVASDGRYRLISK